MNTSVIYNFLLLKQSQCTHNLMEEIFRNFVSLKNENFIHNWKVYFP